MSVESALVGAGVKAAVAAREAPFAVRAMVRFDITTDRRAEMFLAQVLHESMGLVHFEELESGAAYEGRRDLGNVHPGDGRRYKGRGPIQLTGRANYRAAGKALGLDLEGNPKLAASHDVGWLIAGWYWQTRGLNAQADRNDFREVTRRINGAATEGKPSYFARRRSILVRLGPFDCRPTNGALMRDERDRVERYDYLRRKGIRVEERIELRAWMKRRRKEIWRLAQPRSKGGDGKGWGHLGRAERWEALRARSSA